MTSLPKKRTKNSHHSANKYYPVFLNLTNKKCIIVGGGKVAERKCSYIINSGAKVTVISPTLTRRLESYKRDGLIKHIKRTYRSGDIQSAFIVIAATDSKETNNLIAADAAYYNTLLNVVDHPSLCTFIAPSVVRKDSLTIAISTGGISPAMAKTVRMELEKIFGPEFQKYLRLLKGIRIKARDNIPDKRKREALLKKLASPEMINLLTGKGFHEAKKSAIDLFAAIAAKNK